MCGIAGVHNLRAAAAPAIAQATLEDMIAALHHRGPDEYGLYLGAQTGLASARLSIVDLAGGQQPMGNEDGRLWVVYNGEIFNYPELRPDLERRGHHFATHCDTEVILHLYEEYGPQFLNRLNGQFAIALWDEANRTLLLARDRLGIRPLYYTVQGGQLTFGSEAKAIFARPELRAEIDPAALRQVFTYWSPQTPHAIFRGLQEVPPGHYLLAREGQVVVDRYWQLDFAEAAGRSEADALDEFEHLLVDATQIRLRADVPVGAYLSGGLDSSVTAAVIRRHTQSRLDTFSISFADPHYDESAFQRRMVQALGTDHHELFCTHQEIGQALPDVIWHTEMPLLRSAPVPMFLLSRLVNQHRYKVVVTGEGADELLAGYDLFKEAQVRRFWARQPQSQVRPLLLHRLYPDIPRLSQSAAFLAAFFKQGLEQTDDPFYSHRIRWTNTARAWRFLAGGAGGEAEALVPPVALPAAFGGWSPLAQAQYLEITTFLSPYLLASQGDRVGMAHSVEGRYPFLDYRLVEFCSRLPARLKLRGLEEKWLLRQLGRRLVPPEILQRKKRPYRAPIQRSLFTGEAGLDYVGALLAPEAIRDAGYFDPAAVERLARKAQAAAALSEMEEMALMGILTTQLLDQWFVRRQRAPFSPAGGQFRVVDRTAVPVAA